MKTIFAAAALCASSALSSAAIGAPLLFSFQARPDAGYDDYSFKVDDMPAVSEVEPTYFVVDVRVLAKGAAQAGQAYFGTGGEGGGLAVFSDNLAIDLSGPQLFTGTTAMPHLSPGEFTLYANGGASEIAGVLRVSAVASGVPEAATWMMMVAGFGLIGGVVRYRRTRYSQTATCK